jgi:Domain of unknown function (DUF3471)
LKERKEVVVDAKLLDRYVGRYGEPPSLILTIKREGDHLSIQENDEPKQELFAESERQFFSKVSDDELTFQVANQGRATGMILHVDGKDIPIKRID